LNSATLQLTASDNGQTVYFLPADDAAFFANLTNGISDNLDFNYDSPGGGGAGQLGTESNFFSFYTTGFNGVDFQGYDVTDIAIVVNSLVFGPSPNTDSLNMTLEVEGTVAATPEPPPRALLAAGLAIFFLYRRFIAGRRDHKV
jgi:hypothetical protein